MAYQYFSCNVKGDLLKVEQFEPLGEFVNDITLHSVVRNKGEFITRFGEKVPNV